MCQPGTRLEERLTRQDKGINQIDEAAKLHDIAYSQATSPADIRKADNEMIKRVRAATDSSDIQKKIIINALRAKRIGENTGLFKIDQFTELRGLKGSGMEDFTRRIYPSPKQILSSQYLKKKKKKYKPLPKEIDQSGQGLGLVLASTLGPLVIKEVIGGIKKLIKK